MRGPARSHSRTARARPARSSSPSAFSTACISATRPSSPLPRAHAAAGGRHAGRRHVRSASGQGAAPGESARTCSPPRSTRSRSSAISASRICSSFISTARFAATPPEEFVRQLVDSTPSRCGRSASATSGPSGKTAPAIWSFCRSSAREHHFDVVGIKPVTVNGTVVSSTRSARRCEAGDFAPRRRNARPRIHHPRHGEGGAQLGRKLGFPTANLSAHSEQFPPNGVYAAEAKLEVTKLCAAWRTSAIRPTIAGGEPERLLELHLFDLDRDIYGEDVEVRFLRYLRPEQKVRSRRRTQPRRSRGTSTQARAVG